MKAGPDVPTYELLVSSFINVRIAFRIVIALHVFGIFTQAILAGEFLSGTDHAVLFHEYTAWVILGASLSQVGLSSILLRQGLCPLWMTITSGFVFLAETLQAVTGYGRFLGVHIPLGVIIFGMLAVQMINAFGSPE
jgi:hypothetical protein